MNEGGMEHSQTTIPWEQGYGIHWVSFWPCRFSRIVTTCWMSHSVLWYKTS